jgi:hypothetical protein
MLLLMTYVFSKVILTEIHYRCQFSLNFSSQNTKSIKEFRFLFLVLEFLENFFFLRNFSRKIFSRNGRSLMKTQATSALDGILGLSSKFLRIPQMARRVEQRFVGEEFLHPKLIKFFLINCGRAKTLFLM